MKKIVFTGLNGVIGSKVPLDRLSKDFIIYDLYHSSPISNNQVKSIKLNLTNTSKIKEILSDIKPDIIVHMAAITHIDRCEEDKVNGESGDVWKINVEATEEIARYAGGNNSFLIFLSTESVFDGKKKKFDERSKKNPQSWYGMTKHQAEEKVLSFADNSAILRAVITYNTDDDGKTIFGKILNSFQSQKDFKVVSDQLCTPTYTLDIVKAIEVIYTNRMKGIFHVASSKAVTPFEFAVKIGKHFNFDLNYLHKTTLLEYFGKDKARLRLKNSCLDCSQSIKRLGFTPLDFDDVLRNI